MNATIGRVLLLFADQMSSLVQRKSLAGEPGWYYITAHNISYKKNQYYSDKYGLEFNAKSMVGKRMFRMYLNETQFMKLNSDETFKLYKINKTTKKGMQTLTDDGYTVFATQDWDPKYCKPFKVFRTMFAVSNTSSKYLDTDPKVMSYQPQIHYSVKNRLTGGILMSGVDQVEYDAEEPDIAAIRTPRTLAHKGLTGKNQIVNIFDSGVDINNTYFYDPDISVTPFRTNLNHRKIVRYDAWGDSSDYNGGHGTHCAGIIAGKASPQSDSKYSKKSGLHQYDGMAPDAKLYVSDIGVGSKLGGQFDLLKSFENMKAMGVGISSNSWGTDFEEPDLAWNYDIIGYEYPYTIPIFAAGNEGNIMTLCSPGTSKNVLTVGFLGESDSYGIYGSNRKDWIESEDGTIIDILGTTDYSKVIGENIINATVLLASAENENAVLAYDGTNINEARKEASEMKLKGLIHSEGQCSSDSNSIPCIKVSQENLEKVKKQKTISVLYKSTKTSKTKIDEYSSTGPTAFGLTKPDVVAPGRNIYSALGRSTHSDELYALTLNSGTSMATPAVSGIAALIRQYFVDGFYPTLQKSESDSFIPSAALMKAVIINSAIPKREDGKWEPDDTYGFGMPVVDRALGFTGKGVAFLDTEVNNGEHAIYNLKTTKEDELIITMSYIDQYLNYNNVLVVDNLDLILEDPNGIKYFGNNRASETSTTTERVHIDNAPIGEYKIHILFHELPGGEQKLKVGIAVMGGFDTSTSTLSKATDGKKCLYDICDESGFAICPNLKIGNVCQDDIIKNETKISLILKPKITKWIQIKALDTPVYFSSNLKQNTLVSISKEKPRGTNIYADLSLVAYFADGDDIIYMDSENFDYEVDSEGYIYIGLTTIGREDQSILVTNNLTDIAQGDETATQSESEAKVESTVNQTERGGNDTQGPNDHKEDNTQLTTPTIIIIVAAIIVFLMIIAVVVFLVVRKKGHEEISDQQEV